MSGIMIEVKSGPMRVRMHQEDCSNTPEYVEMMMRLASERLIWVQEKTFAMDATPEDSELEEGAHHDATVLARLAAAEAAIEDGLDDDDGDQPQPV